MPASVNLCTANVSDPLRSFHSADCKVVSGCLILFMMHAVLGETLRNTETIIIDNAGLNLNIAAKFNETRSALRVM